MFVVFDNAVRHNNQTSEKEKMDLILVMAYGQQSERNYPRTVESTNAERNDHRFSNFSDNSRRR